MSTIGFPTFTLFAKALLPAGFYGDGGMVGSFGGGEMRVRVFILQVIAQANEVSKHRVSRRQALNARSKGVSGEAHLRTVSMGDPGFVKTAVV